MRKQASFLAVLAMSALLCATPGFAQNVVQFSGKLQIGFSDADNAPITNDAIPICAVATPTGVKHTFGTLLVNARGGATAAGPGAALTFHAVGAGLGGAQVKTNGTCVIPNEPFEDPDFRSRSQIGAARWPGNKGRFTSMYTQNPIPTNPTATYMVSAGGGFDFPGQAVSQAVPFFTVVGGIEAFSKGPNNFGGGIPFSGGGGVQLGINFARTFNNVTLMAQQTTTMGAIIPADFGLVPYANGFLPTDPQLFGTDYQGVSVVPNPISTTTYANGIIVGKNNLTFAARTPGGSTKDDQGFIRTLGGGNTGTGGVGPLFVSPVAFQGAFHQWTTGMVTHSDMEGASQTIRVATGYDVAATGPNGTTRRLQMVSPWAASIRAYGPFGLPIPKLGFGGMATLTLNIIPVPEPGSLAMLGFGLAGLIGLGAAKRRNG